MREKKIKIILAIALTIVLAITISFATLLIIKSTRIKNQKLDIPNTLAVWWWDNSLGVKYLDFAEMNGVDEIYYCDTRFDSNTSDFIKSAKAKNMKVYALWGEKEWIEDRSGFDELMNQYKEYNSNHPTTKFDGVHLDIEPHQFDDFDTYRNTYLLNLVGFVYNTEKIYSSIEIHYDIPFWFDDEVTYKGITKKVYEHIIDKCDKTVIMSYRDTAEKIYDISVDELRYASSLSKSISVSVNMKSNEGDQVSFQEENKRVLYSELSRLDSVISEDFSIAIHHIESWYNLDHGYRIFDL